MNPLNIIIVVVVLVLLYLVYKNLLTDKNTLQNMANAQTAATISASSLATNGSSVSSNFAYSIWLYVNDFAYRIGEPKVVFGRMSAPSATPAQGSVDGVSGVDPCPAVVLGATENNLAVSIGCYAGVDTPPTTPGGNTVVHTCGISNVPLQKWVNLVVSVYGRTMDLYLDGKLVRTCLLPGVASVNPNADVYVTPMGGFDGWTSKFQYYPNALNPQEVWNIYSKGYGSWLSNWSTYSLEISLVENGNTSGSITL